MFYLITNSFSEIESMSHTTTPFKIYHSEEGGNYVITF